ncbi:hypothetical protein F4802DRAFT_566976 [Xylaria palmicola]|nr:hypothetical protein F4802DRAFT_566976 [Xylaria palmicola]
MRYLAIPALLAATARTFFTSPSGHANLTIGSELELKWEIANKPAPTFVLTLRAENTTPYGFIPGPFGSQIGLYDNGAYSWKVEPIGGDAGFIGPEIFYFIRADWNVTGTSYQNGESIDWFHVVH